MKKVAVLSAFLVFFTVTIIANNPLASVPSETTGPAVSTDSADSIGWGSTQDGLPLDRPAPVDPLRSEAPIPSPSTLLLIGSGLIGLIIYRKKHKAHTRS